MKSAGPCCQCKSEIWLPDALYEAAQHGRGKVTFFCPYGHAQVFAEGETDADKFRRERDLLAQRLAEKDDTIKFWREREETASRSLSATRGVITRIKNRVGHGVCPCCNRTFENVARHMASQHPIWSAEAAE